MEYTFYTMTGISGLHLGFSRVWKAGLHESTHLFNKSSWDLCYIPGTVLGTEDYFFFTF